MANLQSAILSQQSSQMGTFPGPPEQKKAGTEEIAMALAGMASNPQIAPFLALGTGAMPTWDMGLGTGGGMSLGGGGGLTQPGGGGGGALAGLQAALQGLSLGGSALRAGSTISGGLSGLYNAIFGGSPGVGPAAPSIEAGLIELLGPELAAQLGYTGAGATSIGSGLTVGGGEAAVGAMTGGAEVGALGAAEGGGMGLLGGGAGAAAAVLPAATILGLLGVIGSVFGVGPMAPKSAQAKYDYSTRSIGAKGQQGYSPADFAREWPDLPGGDQSAIFARIAEAAHPGRPTAWGPSYSVGEMAPFLSIMSRENRYPTAEEFDQLYAPMAQAYWERTSGTTGFGSWVNPDRGQ